MSVVEAPQVATECGCGCGTPINPHTLRVAELRRAGWTCSKIAAELGISTSTVKMSTRQVSRFASGHASRVGNHKWVVRQCKFCGRDFNTPPNSSRERCRNCPVLNHAEQLKLNTIEFDRREAAKNARLRETRATLVGGAPPVARGRSPMAAERFGSFDAMLDEWLRKHPRFQPATQATYTRETARLRSRYDLGDRSFEAKLANTLRQRFERWAKTGAPVTLPRYTRRGAYKDEDLVAAKELLSEVAPEANAEKELLLLIAEQTKDDRSYSVAGSLSLDHLAENGYDAAHFDHEDDEWLLDAARSRTGARKDRA